MLRRYSEDLANRNFDVLPIAKCFFAPASISATSSTTEPERTATGSRRGSKRSPEPGGVYALAAVRDAILGKLGLPSRALRDRSSKNIARPVHIYQIQRPGVRYNPPQKSILLIKSTPQERASNGPRHSQYGEKASPKHWRFICGITCKW
jgi:hypothetical protein